jgi:hypothetical protein
MFIASSKLILSFNYIKKNKQENKFVCVVLSSIMFVCVFLRNNDMYGLLMQKKINCISVCVFFLYLYSFFSKFVCDLVILFVGRAKLNAIKFSPLF